MSRTFSFEVAEAVHAVSIKILRMVRTEDTKSGIGPAQLSALSVLVFVGPQTMGELAAAEQVKPPTMSRIVDALVKQRLAERRTLAEDRRTLRVAATGKGRKILFAGRTRRVRTLDKRLRELSRNELQKLSDAAQLLARI